MKSQIVYFLLVLWGAIEVFLFAGIIFGWASLVYIFKLDYYFDFCSFHENLMNDNISFARADNQNQNLSWPTSPTRLVENLPISSVTEAVTLVFDGIIGKDSLNRSESRQQTSPCLRQDEQFTLIYTLAVAINGLSTFFNGWVLDRFGTCLCRVCAIVLYASACVMIIVSSPASAFWLFPGMIILTWSGYLILMTNFQLANLLPEKRSTIISLYCGAYDSSAFVLVLVKFAYAGGISVQTSFTAILILLSVVIISTVWFMPTFKIPVPLPPNYEIDMSCSRLLSICGLLKTSKNDQSQVQEIKPDKCDLNESGGSLLSDKSSQKAAEAGDTSDDVVSSCSLGSVSFLSQLLMPMFIWDVVWLTCHRFVSWSFVGRLNARLDRLALNDEDVVGRYTSVFASLQFFGIFIAPFSGMLMDRGSKKKNRSKAERLSMCIPSFLIDTVWGLLLVISLLTPWIESMYVSFVLHVLHRAMLYGPNSAFIAAAFSPSHFGKLFGFAMSFSAGVSLLQYPLFKAIQGPLQGNSMFVDLLSLAMILLSFCHPMYIYFWCRRIKRERSQQHQLSPIYKPSAQRTGLVIEETKRPLKS